MSQWLSTHGLANSARANSGLASLANSGLASLRLSSSLRMCKATVLLNPVKRGYLCGPVVRPCHSLKLLAPVQLQSGRHNSYRVLRRSQSLAHTTQCSQRMNLFAIAALHAPQSTPASVTAAGYESASADSEDESNYGGNYDLEMAIFEFMEQSNNPNSFPTKRQLLEAGRRDLVAAIEAEGGWLTIGWDSEAEDGPDSSDDYGTGGGYWDSSSNGSSPPPPMSADTPVTRPSPRDDGPGSLPRPLPMNGTFGGGRSNELASPSQQRQVTAASDPSKAPPRGAPRAPSPGPAVLPRPVAVTGDREKEAGNDRTLSQRGQVSALEGYENEIRRAMRGIGEPVIRRDEWETMRESEVVEREEGVGRGAVGAGASTDERGREEATVSGRGVTDEPGNRRKLRSAGAREEDATLAPTDSARSDRWTPGVASRGSEVDNLEKRIEQKGGWEAVKTLFGLKNTGNIKPAPNAKARTRAARPQAQPGVRSKGPGATGSKAETAPVVDRWEPPRRALDFSSRGSSPVSVWRPDTGPSASSKSGLLTSREEADAVVKRRRKRRKKKTPVAGPGADRWQSKDPPGDTVENVVLALASGRPSTAAPAEKEKAEADAPNAGPATLRSRSDLSGMAERIRALENKLAATRTALQTGRESLMQSEQQFKQVRDRTVEELVRVTDSLEFREGEILRTRKELRSTKAQVAALEGKIATDIREAKQVLEDRQKRLSDAHAALKELRSTRIVWPDPAGEVMLAGSFDGWSNRVKMEKSNAGVFVASLQLYPGRYEVKFIVDGSWRVDPRRPIVYSGGNENNIIIIN